MRFKGLLCPKGHGVGNITYRHEKETAEEGKRNFERKLIDDIYFCMECRKFYKLSLIECDFIPKTPEGKPDERVSS